jgi:hypothetical protein
MVIQVNPPKVRISPLFVIVSLLQVVVIVIVVVVIIICPSSSRIFFGWDVFINYVQIEICCFPGDSE